MWVSLGLKCICVDEGCLTAVDAYDRSIDCLRFSCKCQSLLLFFRLYDEEFEICSTIQGMWRRVRFVTLSFVYKM